MPEAEGMAGRMRFAVLVDGENASPNYIQQMLEEVARNGVPTIRRVYGDWSQDHMNGWEKVLHDHALQPIQSSSFVPGKGSTDANIIIDAMDILYAGNVDAFCIISSDSDYTRLVTRLREEGKFVMAIGDKRRTANPLIRAVNLFVDPRNLVQKPSKAKRASGKQAKASDNGDSKAEWARLEEILVKGYELAEGDDGWAELGNMGEMVRQVDSSFDHREYGAEKLLDLIEAHSDVFETRRERTSGPSPVYIRRKD